MSIANPEMLRKTGMSTQTYSIAFQHHYVCHYNLYQRLHSVCTLLNIRTTKSRKTETVKRNFLTFQNI